MASHSLQNLHVVPFNGTGFSNWNFRVKLALEQAGVHEVLETSVPAPEEEAKFKAWKKKDVIARNILVQCLSDNVLETVKLKDTAKAMLDTLNNTYARKGISSQVMYQKKLRSMKYTEEKPLSLFLSEFEQAVCELKAAGGKIENNEMILQLLSAMPESYQSVVTAIDIMFCQDESKVTFEFVKNKLLMEEARKENKSNCSGNSSGNDAAFAGYRKKWYKRQDDKKPVFQFNCHNCGKKGHKKYECPKLRMNKNFKEKESAHVAENSDDSDDDGNGVVFLTTEYSKSEYGLSSRSQQQSDCEEVKFIIDSGCTNHLVTKHIEKFLKNTEEVSHEINLAKKGETIQATKKGNLHVKTENNTNVLIKDVWVCSGLYNNLLSVRKLEQNGLEVTFKDQQVKIMKNNVVILKGELCGNLYIVKLRIYELTEEVNMATDEIWLQHRRMGHSSKYPAPGVCEVCMKGKQTRNPFKPLPAERKAKRVLEVVSTDVCGPITPPTHDGKRYYVSFIDHYSHFAICYLLSHKSEVLEKFKKYYSHVKTKFGTSIERLRCDNGGEYSSIEFKNFCNKNGIKIQYTIAHNPEQNGVAERYNRTVLNKARCLLFDSELDKSLWGEAVRTAFYLTNRTKTKCVPNNQTPAELWYGGKPDLNKIKLFGATAYNLIPKEDRKSKLESHSKKLIMVGYKDNGYRLWDPDNQRIVYGRNTVFDENKKDKIPVEIKNITNKENMENQESESLFERKETDSESETEAKVHEKNKNVRRSTRPIKLPKHLNDYDLDLEAANLMTALSAEMPQSYEEAVQDDNWQVAIQEELTSLKECGTWELTEPPENQEIIDSKWVFREKLLNGKVVKKARLVARGFKQSSLESDVYAPVAKMVTIRVLLCLYLEKDLQVQQLDVSSAFLYGNLEKPVYMELPKGLDKNSNLVCKVTKSLYGLKQAPKCWNDLFHKKLTNLGLNRSKKDPCLYYNHETFLLVYVDDVIIFSQKSDNLFFIKNELSKDFKMTEFKNSKITFLGLEIKKIGNELYISQKELINKILNKFNMEDCRPSEVPMQPKLQLSVGANTSDDSRLPYRELIGCLMYVMLGSRPDLCFCITYFSQFQSTYTENHWKHLKGVLRYLSNTKNYGLKFIKSNNSSITLTSYVDSDFASSIIDRKSISGFVIKLNDNLIFWKTKKQNIVTLSSAESEYVALSTCVTENLFLGQMLSEILKLNIFPVYIHEDNQSCIRMASTLESKRTKHIDTRYHFIRDCVNDNKIIILYVPTEKQEADMLTKPLAQTKFKNFRDLLRIIEV